MIGRIEAGQGTQLVEGSLRLQREGASPLFWSRYESSSPRFWATVGQQAWSTLLAAHSLELRTEALNTQRAHARLHS
jgi:hypothetical protein